MHDYQSVNSPNKRQIRYGSVCSGIEAATIAWEPLGWKPAFFSEIEKFPRGVLQHHWPDVPLHGDFTTIKGDEYESIDLLVGGTPCQSFSIAGLRGGMDDDRGNLALEFLKLAKRSGARWVVWENVPGIFSSTSHATEDPCPPPNPLDMECDGQEVETEEEYDSEELHAFNCMLAGFSELGFQYAYRVFDAQYFGVPQRRRRVFVVGYLGKDIHPAAVLFERHGLQGHPAPSREAGQEITGTLEASLGRSRGAGTPTAGIVPDASKLSHWEGGPHPTLNQSNNTGGIAMSNQELFSQGGAGLVDEGFYVSGHGKYAKGTGTLRASGGDAGMGSENLVVSAFGGGNCSGPIDVAATLTAKGCRQDFEVETFCVQHAVVGRSDNAGPQGKDYQSDIAFTQDSRPTSDVVAYRTAGDGAAYEEGAVTAPLTTGTDKSANIVAFAQNQCGEVRENTISGTLNTNSNPSSRNAPLVRNGMAVRRLMPIECERLQGFPDKHTRIPYRNKAAELCPDGPRYAAIGNSMPVPVMKWIGERIQAVEDIRQQLKVGGE